MKKVMLFTILMAIINAACKKETTTTTVTGPILYIPHNLDSLLLTPTSSALRPFISNVNGVFTSCRVSAALTDTSGTPHNYRRNWQNALFTDSVYSVSVNGHMLSADTNRARWSIKAYFNSYDDGTVWNDIATNNWNITGITAPSFSVDLDGTIPSFTGILPASISRSSDFIYAFNTSNCADADSAYIIVYTGGSYAQSACVSARGGVVKITSSQFVSYSSSTAKDMTRIDGKIFYGTTMAIVLFSHTFHTVGDKRYVFVKQRIILNMVELT